MVFEADEEARNLRKWGVVDGRLKGVLKNWEILQRRGAMAYQDPALRDLYVKGEVVDHADKRFYPGKRIITSAAQTSDPAQRTVTTGSGSVYLLAGPPTPEYVAYLRARHPGMDPFPVFKD